MSKSQPVFKHHVVIFFYYDIRNRHVDLSHLRYSISKFVCNLHAGEDGAMNN